MTDIEKQYFDKLKSICATNAEVLNHPMIVGVKETISNLYREKAHFVYELLQNADDQGATECRFILGRNDLVFIHNAPRHFSISNPDTHQEDQRNGKLGDVNSILSIAASSKNNNDTEIKIGKFGLGFKSVFQYTDKPEIYDDNIRFSIIDHILPDYIENDHPLRRTGETLFFFKFKEGEKSKAYNEISDRLKGLVYPLLFLNHLKKIDWESEEETGFYSLENIGEIGNGQKLRYEVLSDGEISTKEMWKFKKYIDDKKGLYVSVVFPMINGELASVVNPLYCYLPTARETNLPVILHAPFKLTGNRESIVAKDPHNILMIEELGDLLVSALKDICEEGQSKQTPWINENIIDFLPKNSGQSDNKNSIDISSITQKVDDAMTSIPMLWCEDYKRYLLKSEARIVENKYLPQVYSSEMISEIFDVKCGWVLTSLYSTFKDDNYLRKNIGIEVLTPEKILRRITPEFLEKQSFEWLCAWYKSLLEVPKFWENGNDPFLRFKPIILSSENATFVAPYSKENKSVNIQLPLGDDETANFPELKFVDARLLEDEEIESFIKRIGIKEIDEFTYAERILQPTIKDDDKSFEDRLRALVSFAKIFTTKLNKEQERDLKEKCLIPVQKDGEWEFINIEKVKIHNHLNDFFFQNNPDIVFFEPDALSSLISQEDIEILKSYIDLFPSTKGPIVKMEKVEVTTENSADIPKEAIQPAYYNRNIDHEYFEEPCIEGIEYFINNIGPLNPQKASEAIIDLVHPKYINAYYHSKYYGAWNRSEPITPLYMIDLENSSWIAAASNQLKELIGLPTQELSLDEVNSLKEKLSQSGIVSGEEMENFLQYIMQNGILDEYKIKKEIENLKEVVKASNPFTLKWLDDILELRLKYIESGEKDDIDYLISSLKNALGQLNIDANTDLRDLLPNNLNIIFGPPGTGKTTKIVDLIKEKINENPEAKILVLTPTNASAKVVAERLNLNNIIAFRGVNPKNHEVVKELEDLDIPVFNSEEDDVPNILVSTIHYFSRNYASKNKCYIHDIEWDSIFIDESSMVTLDYMLFALLKGSQNNENCKFYIVGDPLQLPAITNLDPFILEEAQLDDFNFYSFIGLDEFSENPDNLYSGLKDKVNIYLLKNQYRSVEPLCDLMSKFAYKGMVQSDFKGKDLNLPEESLSILKSPFSIVRFPVTKNPNNPEESKITDLNKLKASNFNIYSALLLKNIITNLLDTLNRNEWNDSLSIGIITPYIAQKKLIEKLLNTGNLSRGVSIDIKVNTIHQFQGDEFDIVFLILNPPNISMSPKENILINKHYLVNVGISRAKNNLVILYPDETCYVDNFIHINKNNEHNNVEKIAEEVFKVDIRKITIHSSEVEEELFGEKHHLMNISQVTHHEEVNYHNPPTERGYTFVIGGNTIDIIHSKN